MELEQKKLCYKTAFLQLSAILKDETDMILKMVTVNSVLKQHLPYYFWVGFYLVKGGELVVGPYQGTLGCLHIAFGKGVCGTAAEQLRTQIVPDVHKFPGHISCDALSASEIVVPVFSKGRLIGVFDVDSTEKSSFDDVDQQYLEQLFSKIF